MYNHNKITRKNKYQIIFGSVGIGWAGSTILVNFYNGNRQLFGIFAFILFFVTFMSFLFSFLIYDLLIPNTKYGFFLRSFPGLILGFNITLMFTRLNSPGRMSILGALILFGVIVISSFYMINSYRLSSKQHNYM